MADPSFTLRRIAVPAFGPSLLFGIGEGAILPVIPLSARELGACLRGWIAPSARTVVPPPPLFHALDELPTAEVDSLEPGGHED